ncbi:MAG: HigA family addiction module antitoxin, partial [Cyanobacteria bacterium J06553_1]
PIHNPPAPGEILSEDYLKPLGIEPAEIANRLGIVLTDVTDLLAGRSAVTADVALRLGITLGTTPEIWLGLQQQYDLWQARQHFTAELKPYRRASAVLS